MKHSAIITGSLAFALALALGCRSDSPPAAPGDAPDGQLAANVDRPALRQHLVTAVISDPKTFNPITSTDNASATAFGDLFDTLVRLNLRTTEIEPALAEQWECVDEGTVCTFSLRKDVRWHDGEPFTADDVLFTFQAIHDKKVPTSLKHALSVDGHPIEPEKVDEHTIRFRLPRPFAPLLNSLAIPIIPEHVLASSLEADNFARQWHVKTPPEQLIGTGPYRMVTFEANQFIRYKRNTDYWMRDEEGQPLPYLEERTIRIVPSQDTMYLKFAAGETDIHNARPEEVPDLRSREDELSIRIEEVGLDTGALFLTFNRNPRHYEKNGKRDPRLDWFTDKQFLRAIAHSIDRASMVANCLHGFGSPATALISPENTKFHDSNLVPYEYDLDVSRAFLANAGYIDRDGDGVIEDPKGNRVAFSLNTNAGNGVREKMCSMIKEDWARLGIEVHYRPLDFTMLVEKLDHNFDWDAILIGFTGVLEPHNGANLLHSKGNLHLWNPNQESPSTKWEATIDSLLEKGSRELDKEERRRVYWEIQEILHEELPMIQTVLNKRFFAFKKSLEHFEPTVWGLHRPERIRFSE